MTETCHGLFQIANTAKCSAESKPALGEAGEKIDGAPETRDSSGSVALTIEQRPERVMRDSIARLQCNSGRVTRSRLIQAVEFGQQQTQIAMRFGIGRV